MQGQKRKSSGYTTAEELPAAKKGKTNDKGPKDPKVPKEPKTKATGFLSDGTWVEDAKFACVSCRRGHRAWDCKDGMNGVPVQLVDHAGRPPKGSEKIKTTCKCGPNQCQCRHPSYLLERICIDGVDRLKIKATCISDSKAKIVQLGLS